MTSSRPYLIRALYEWILDNNMTPHILVNAKMDGVEVPQQYVHEGRVVLNIKPSAVHALQLGDDWIEFSARFGGNPYLVRVPTHAVIAIYARENDQGMVFGDDASPPSPDEPSPNSVKTKRPNLKVIK